MQPQLRTFVQRDDNQIREYLEAIEGGAVAGPIVQTEGSKGSLGGGLGLGVPVGKVGVHGEKGSEASSKANVVRTPAGNFQRLYDYLQGGKYVDSLEACDDNQIEGTPVGQILEIYVVGKLSSQDRQLIELQEAVDQMAEGMRLADEFKGLVEPVVEAAASFGVDITRDDPEFSESIEKLRRFKAPALPGLEAPRKMAVIGTLIGYRRPAFLIPVHTATLQKDPPELNGEYTVLGKVIRKITSGSTCSANEFSSLPTALSRKQRRKAKASRADQVSGPALVIEPIAIYR